LECLENRWVPSITPLISGAASVEQEASYSLHLSETGAPASSIQGWSINWGDGNTQTVSGNPSSATHVYTEGNQDFTISATATDTSNHTFPTLQNVKVDVLAPVVLNFTTGTAVHLQGGAPTEYTSYTQNGFVVTADAAVDGAGAHFHLANGALYTHVHDDEPGGPGVVTMKMQSGAAFMLDSLVVPQLDNTANGGSLTFTDSNGDSLTATAAGTYSFNWGPITSFTITPNNLLDSVDERGYVDSIAVAPVTPPAQISPAITGNTASPIAISGFGSVDQNATYTLHLANPGVASSTIQGWSINWGDGNTQTVTGDPTSVTHVYTSGNETYTITASATGNKTETSTLTNTGVTYLNSYLAPQSIAVSVQTPFVKPTISGSASVEQEGTYILHLVQSTVPSNTIQGWSINWGDGNTQTVTGDPSSVTHVYTEGNQAFNISATAEYAGNSYAAVQNVAVNVVAPVVLNFTTGTAVHLQGGAPDEYISYTQNGFIVTPVAVVGGGAHFHLANGALYTHVHDDEPGGPGVVQVKMQSGATFMLDSLVVPQLDNAANGGSLTFTDSKGDSLTVTSAGTYSFDWGPITYFTVTPNKLLSSLDERGYFDSIAVAPVKPPAQISPAVTSNTASPITISGASSVHQGATYTLHLSNPGVPSSTIQSWSINWGDGNIQTVTGDPSSVTHIYTEGHQTFTINATANGIETVNSTLTSRPVTFVNSYLAGGSHQVNVKAQVLIDFTSGKATHLKGGAADEYINYTQQGFDVTPLIAEDGEGAHFHLANGALYTHVHDDELGGPGIVTLQDQNGAAMFMVNSLVVPALSAGGSLTFSDSNGDSLTVTAAGTYNLNWGPVSSFTVTPNNLLDSLGQKGYVDSISVSTVS